MSRTATVVLIGLLVLAGVIVAIVLATTTGTSSSSSNKSAPWISVTPSLAATTTVTAAATATVARVPFWPPPTQTTTHPLKVATPDTVPSEATLLSSPPPLPPCLSAWAPLFQLGMSEEATCLAWNPQTQILLVGLPWADQGFGRVQAYQLHTELASSTQSDERDMALGLLRSVPFSLSGTLHQRAGHRIRQDLVLAPQATLNKTSTDVVGALYYFPSDGSTLRRLNTYTQDQFRLCDTGDIFRWEDSWLVLAKRQGLRDFRLDVFEFAPQTGQMQPKFHSSLPNPHPDSSDFGHNFFRVKNAWWVATPSVSQLNGFEYEPLAQRWSVTQTWDFSSFTQGDAAELSFWPEKQLLVISCVRTAVTHLVEWGTWRLVATLDQASHHKLSGSQLMTWHDQQLQVYPSPNAVTTPTPIVDAELLTPRDIMVLTATRQLLWFSL